MISIDPYNIQWVAKGPGSPAKGLERMGGSQHGVQRVVGGSKRYLSKPDQRMVSVHADGQGGVCRLAARGSNRSAVQAWRQAPPAGTKRDPFPPHPLPGAWGALPQIFPGFCSFVFLGNNFVHKSKGVFRWHTN